MTAAQHTPGPWFVMPNGLYVADKHVWFDESGARWGETPNIIIDCPTEADARLIAAAPDLLEALENAENFIAGFEGDEMQDKIDARLTAIRAAIAKAKGGAQ